ncbi:MAG: sugar transferase [Armatimonadetes bacterium]|nr:sugar transferase [Armatimonadota bacterium]
MKQLIQARRAAQPEGLSPFAYARPYDRLRRLVDIVASLLGLVLLAPLMLAIAVAIKLDSHGPVFFRQQRVGRNRRLQQTSMRLLPNVFRLDLRRDHQSFGRIFEMVKFRTMRVDAEAQTGPIWSTEHDPRVTRVGRVLRRTRLDELPQLWNVLRGEMSLVGPRPERPEFVRMFVQTIDGYAERHWITPGITGLSQVRQGYDRCLDDVRRKLGHDLEYIQRRSLWLDLQICWRTVAVMLVGRGSC